ncbi:GHKL domain-containing protein [Anaerosporobacter sp.]|uniref:GHKL domain-containing protein n=1 Tax=Anaerosporobacter sp. TaxID=1872529 RepID=UPI00286FA6B8|nr:GHKL domain-containing protein [Anaerosporobacter sp.]
MCRANASRGETMAELVNRIGRPVLYPFRFALIMLVMASIWSYVFYMIEHSTKQAAKIERLERCLCIVIALSCMLFYYPGFVRLSWGGSAVAASMLKVVVMAVTIQVIGYVTLHFSDIILFTSVMAIMQYYEEYQVFGKSILFFSAWFLFCILIRRRYGKLQTVALQSVISFLSGILSYYLFGFIYQKGIGRMYYDWSKQWKLNNMQKMIFLCLLAMSFVVIFAGVLLVMKKILSMYIENVRAFSEKYKEIGRYLFIMPIFFGLILLVLDFFDYESMRTGGSKEILIQVVCYTFFIGVQLFYIRLLIQTVRLKEHLQFQELEKESIERYQQDMNKNMMEIREMKHDLKNIFLTMGGYVSRSNDEEMKEYYYENIAPFAGNEIRRNDLYVSLQEIANESLKAFLYYKYLETQNYQQELQVITISDQSFLPYLTNTSDIIRILGIFIDNAREECAFIEDGYMELTIKEKDGQIQFSVKNPIRESVMKSGIHIGTTSKGLGRGNGLDIVNKIIKKHDDILWNSYFKDDAFVQSISMWRR